MKLGLDCVLYENSATWASPTFAVLDNVNEVTTTIDAAEGEAKHRGLTWAEYDRGLLQGAININLVYNGDNADFQTLRDAFLNKTDKELFVADGLAATSGTQGLRGEFRIMSMERGEPLEGVLTMTFAVKPALGATNKPTWHEIS